MAIRCLVDIDVLLRAPDLPPPAAGVALPEGIGSARPGRDPRGGPAG